MKKYFIAILFVLFIWASPAMAFLGDIDVDVAVTNKAYGGKATVCVKNENTQGVTQIVEAAETKRDYFGPGNIEYATPGIYKEPSKYGAEFTAFEDLTRYKKRFSYKHALKHYGKSYGRGKCITIGGSYSGRHENDPTEFVDVITDEQVDLKTMEPVGFLTIKTNPKWKKKWFIRAADKEVDSFTVLQKAVLSACIMQGNYIKKVREGATFESWNRGRGIGWNTSGGIVNDMGNRGRAGSTSGGTGWSEGEAGNDTLPWLVVQVFKRK